MYFDNVPDSNPRVATSTVKWDLNYRKKMGIRTGPADSLTDSQLREVKNLCKKAYRALDLNGYARMDLRLDREKGFYLIEANPNPDIGFGEEFADSAEHIKVKYPKLIQKIINLGLRW
ncbi:MAG: hypothetical protein R2827_08390 [Bdellovibrionales bacterium]